MSPVRFWCLSMDMIWMAAEAQAVVAMRMAGMAGLCSLGPHETNRMVAEKVEAGMRSAFAMQRAAFFGASPIALMGAGIGPIRHKTRANARRLSRRGPVRR